jgi:hypothetical protein
MNPDFSALLLVWLACYLATAIMYAVGAVRVLWVVAEDGPLNEFKKHVGVHDQEFLVPAGVFLALVMVGCVAAGAGLSWFVYLNPTSGFSTRHMLKACTAGQSVVRGIAQRVPLG